MQKRVLRFLAQTACRKYKLVLWAALAVTVASWMPPVISWLHGGLHAPFDLSTMLPQGVPAARDFTRAVIDFDTVDEAVVVFHLGSPDEREPSAARLAANPALGTPEARAQRRQDRLRHVPLAGRAADALIERVSRDERIRSAFTRRFLPQDRDYLLYEALPSYGLLLLDENEIPRLKELLEPDAIRASVQSVQRKLSGALGSSGQLDEWLLMDAIGLGTVFQRALGRYGMQSEEQQTNGGWLVDKDATMLLAVIQPDRPAQSIDFSAQISAFIRQTAAEVYEQTVPPAARSSIRMEFGGGYEAAVGYTSHVNFNLISTLLTSLAGVLALFGLVFKRVGVLLYIGIPLVMVVSWTIGFGWLLYGQLNVISACFAAVLVALGIDYAIHIYNRYISERSRGADIEEAFTIALENTGWGVIIGMVTTAAAFISLGATRFSQLAEFGILAGTGIFLSAPVMLLVLPALLCWRYRESGERAATLKPLGLGLGHLGAWVQNNAGKAAFLGGILAVCSVILLFALPQRLVFDERISSLRPPERVFELSGEIARAFSNRNPNSLMLLAYGPTQEEAVENAARLQHACADLEKDAYLAAYESFLRYLPPPSSQRRILAALREADLPRAREVFMDALEENGLDPDYFLFTDALLERHAQRARDDHVLLPGDLADTPLWRYIKRFVSQRRRVVDLRDPLPDDLAFPVTIGAPAVSRSEEIKARPGDTLSKDSLLALYHDPSLKWQDQVKRATLLEPSGWVVKISIYPPLSPNTKAGDPAVDEVWLQTILQRLDIDPSRSDNTAVLAGVPILAHELAGIVKTDITRVSWAVLVVCAVILLIFFCRHPARMLASLLPILLGLLYLSGFMTAFGISFNFVNTLVIPIIIGLGVDNGIHLTERFFESGRRASIIISDTGRALIVTALTSCAGFGSLAISGYEGIASMGRLSIYALGWVLFASLVITPAIMHLVWNRSKTEQA